MAIDPNITNTVRVGQLPVEPYNLSDLIPHEVGGDLKQGTLQQMADVIGSYLSVSGGVGFRAVTVNDGDTLPATTEEEFILVGKGTFYNVGGGATIFTTEELNALVSNGTYWFIGVEIPINVELAGITQFIRSGFTNTTPSEDAVFNALSALSFDPALYEKTANKQDNLNYDGTAVKYPTVDGVNDWTRKMAKVATKTGLLSKLDTFNLVALSTTTARIGAVEGAMFWNDLFIAGTSPANAIKSFAQKDYPLTQLITATGGNVNVTPLTTDGKYIRYLGYDKNGNVYSSGNSFATNNDVLQIGFVTVVKSGSAVTFLDGTTVGGRNVFPQPNLASNTDFDKVAAITSNVTVSANAGASLATNNGNITGISINWKSISNPSNGNPIDVFNYTGVSVVPFAAIDPTFLSSTGSITPHTVWTEFDGGIQINQAFFNTTTGFRGTMANGSASVARILIGVRGGIYVQFGEFPTTACYGDLATAKNNIFNHKFTDAISPTGVTIEIARVAYTKSASAFTNDNQFYIVNTSSGSGASSGSIPPVSDATVATKGIIKLSGDFDATSTADLPVIKTANTSQSGKISSIDWNTFNNKLSGTGSTNYLPKSNGAISQTDSQIFDNGVSVGVNTSSDFNIGTGYDAKFSVLGGTRIESPNGENLMVNTGTSGDALGTTGHKSNVLAIRHTATDGSAAIRILRASDAAEIGAVGFQNNSGNGWYANGCVFLAGSMPYYNGAPNVAPPPVMIAQEGLYAGSFNAKARYKAEIDWSQSFYNADGSFAMAISPIGKISVGSNSYSTKFQVRVNPSASGDDGIRTTDGTRIIQSNITGSSFGYIGIGANETMLYSTGSPLNIASDGDIIKFIAGANEKARILTTGQLLLGTNVNNGRGVAQVNGNITASPATLSDQVVVFSQLPTSGEYAITVTSVVGSVSAVGTGTYTKVGNIVTVRASVTGTMPSSGSADFDITLPVNRFDSSSISLGSGSFVSSNIFPALVDSSLAVTTVRVHTTTSSTSFTGSVTFQYKSI